MASSSLKNRYGPSRLGGTMMISRSTIGAGMLSLPTVTSGVWFSGSVLLLICTWSCMLISGLMILETLMHYPNGSGFQTSVKDLLGKNWNAVNGVSIALVLYVLIYAYISVFSSIIQIKLEGIIRISQMTSSLLFVFVSALMLSLFTRLLDRLSTILIGGMVFTFLVSVSDMFTHVRSEVLFNYGDHGVIRASYALVALPYLLGSFGYHASIPALVKYYYKDSGAVSRSMVYGTLLALTLYILWQYVIQGNIVRDSFRQVIARGGSINNLLDQVENVSSSKTINNFINIFSYIALTSSFLGASSALFNYLADLYTLSDDTSGRIKTVMLTLIPSTLASLLFPNSFLNALGCAGIGSTLWALIVPALMVRASRRRYSCSSYCAPGGNAMIPLIISFGLINALAYILSFFGLLPVFK